MSQMHKFALSVQSCMKGEIPVDYPGAFTEAVATRLLNAITADYPLWFIRKAAGNIAFGSQKDDLSTFGCEFDTFYKESWLHHPSSRAIDHAFALGKVWETGKDGLPICGNCASRLTPLSEGKCEPCPFCMGHEPAILNNGANPLSYDSALSPENDFMADEHGSV